MLTPLGNINPYFAAPSKVEKVPIAYPVPKELLQAGNALQSVLQPSRWGAWVESATSSRSNPLAVQPEDTGATPSKGELSTAAVENTIASTPARASPGGATSIGRTVSPEVQPPSHVVSAPATTTTPSQNEHEFSAIPPSPPPHSAAALATTTAPSKKDHESPVMQPPPGIQQTNDGNDSSNSALALNTPATQSGGSSGSTSSDNRSVAVTTFPILKEAVQENTGQEMADTQVQQQPTRASTSSTTTDEEFSTGQKDVEKVVALDNKTNNDRVVERAPVADEKSGETVAASEGMHIVAETAMELEGVRLQQEEGQEQRSLLAKAPDTTTTGPTTPPTSRTSDESTEIGPTNPHAKDVISDGVAERASPVVSTMGLNGDSDSVSLDPTPTSPHSPAPAGSTVQGAEADGQLLAKAKETTVATATEPPTATEVPPVDTPDTSTPSVVASTKDGGINNAGVDQEQTAEESAQGSTVAVVKITAEASAVELPSSSSEVHPTTTPPTTVATAATAATMDTSKQAEGS